MTVIIVSYIIDGGKPIQKPPLEDVQIAHIRVAGIQEQVPKNDRGEEEEKGEEESEGEGRN